MLDGEGIGRRPHRYVYLAAADMEGETWDVGRGSGLSTEDCLDLILSLPSRALIVGFALGYDYTKILADLPDRLLWALLHESARAKFDGKRITYAAVRWRGYRLNYMNRRLTVAAGKTSRTVWDVFRFFQCSFVRACSDWKVGTEELATIEAMKERRATFAASDLEEIAAYCRAECRIGARLITTLLDAHDEAGISLRQYNGPGSSASVVLRRLGIDGKRGEIPEAMTTPVASAFFGGRFECSRVGAVEGDVWGYDLASAYPYAATQLPCLVHGRWKRAKIPSVGTLRDAHLALIRWTGGTRAPLAWGALPVRDRKGSIIFPLSGEGGWCWRDEFLAGRELVGRGLVAREAWLYRTRCVCPKPFASLAELYRERVRWGKEGPGKTLKLAVNSVYGKLAQSAGLKPPFQSWVMAGNITSLTRAELLRAIAAAPSPSCVVMVATDGLYSTARLSSLRAPADTGTGDLKVPLGVWEEKAVPGGIFAARPGVYFPLRSDVGGEPRARGIGRAVLQKHRQDIVDALARGEEAFEIGGFQRFIGAKSAIRRSADGRDFSRSDDYGEWVDWKIRLSFDPRPKRRATCADGTLVPWPRLDFPSEPYDPANRSPEADALGLGENMLDEQPEGELELAP